MLEPATPELINKINSERTKVQNANHQRVVKSAKEADILTVLQKFSKNRTPAEWINEKLHGIESTDPNAFLIIECDSTDGTRYVEPYPFIANSASVLDFKRSKRDELLYLIVSSESNDGQNTRYTGYFRGFSVVFEPIEGISQGINKDIQVLGITKKTNTETIYSVIFGEFRYDVSVLKSLANSILAMPIGYIKSDFGFQSVIDTVSSAFAHFVRQNVDYKYCVMKAGSPTKLEYRLVNTPNDDDGDENNIGFAEKPIQKPRLKLSKGEEKTDGIIINIDEQRFLRQITPENIPPLSTYFQFISADPLILEFLRSEHDRAESAVLRGIFGIDYNSNPEKVKTATEVFSNNSSVHAALIPFDTHCLKMWKFIVESAAQLMGVTDCQVSYVQDTDYRLTTVGELLKLLESLKNTDAPQALRIAIYEKIIERLFEKSPQKVAEIKEQIRFDPFIGLSFDEIQRRIDSPLVSEGAKKLHLNLKSVFDEIDMQYVGFQGFKESKKAQIIGETVKTIQ